MTRIIGLTGVFLVSLALGLFGMAAAWAGDGRVPLPVLAKAKGEKCVEPAEDMRRYHMVYLEHQRDETLRRGIRSNKYSLKECVACHASPDAAAGGAETVRPFCSACHDYTAVRIDCFECHTPKPAKGSRKP